ncbi:UNVERIFIED_CONTAM: ABC transporter G family member 22 [Sesamum radiatum]|uniref:ABC transporter G family member 22 n=1 Tax=Sesamum radiatum TaxID=300843 RepID=A0AAW2R3Z1_SESRA
MMEKANSANGLIRTKSVETILKSPVSSAEAESSGGLSRKSSRRLAAASPGRSSSGNGNNTHIRKSRSAQMKFELDDLGSGAALSRASSASLGSPSPSPASPCRRMRLLIRSRLAMTILFTDVTYKVVLKGMTSTVEKDILNGITGSVSPGEVLALMGPSGSGKTTLLSLLGGRVRESTYGGSITYNDQSIGFVTRRRAFPHLTVKETLTYAARLRLPRTLTKEDKDQRASDVIYELGLERNIFCQVPRHHDWRFLRSGVSGGERKRVCIGNEIIVNPSLLFLDEPTSGLDSTTALRILETLHGIAEAGKTVITTIHQPSSRLFLKFDKLILLGKGSLLYFGKAPEAMVYFSSVGCSPLIAMNPAEFMLDLANGNVTYFCAIGTRGQSATENSEEETKNGKPDPAIVHEYLVEAYETRVAENEKRKIRSPVPIDEEIKSKVCSTKREWGASWLEQYSILFWRGLKERKHDYFSWLRITQVLQLQLFWDYYGGNLVVMTPKTARSVFTAVFTFPQERAMLSKERAVDMYSLSAYFVARTTSDLPLDLILPVLFLLVVYFMAGLRMTVGSFLLTVVTVFLYYSCSGTWAGYWCYTDGFEEGNHSGLRDSNDLHAGWGYFVKDVPMFISWLRYLSFNYHTYKLLLKVQYEHITHSINGVSIDKGYKEVGVLAAMVVGYRLLAYLSLRRMKLHPGA